jgi:hypothetical protein
MRINVASVERNPVIDMDPDSARAEERRAARPRLGGLGRGLAEILPTGESPSPESSAGDAGPELPADQHHLMFADLETIAEALGVDLCAYLYRPMGEGFRVVVTTRPDVAGAPDPFALLDLMRASVPSIDQTVTVGPYECTMITSSGRRSSGVLLIGKLREPLTPTKVRLAWRLCRLGALASVLD